EDLVWRRLADVVRAARSGVDLPPAAAEIAERQLFHAASWPTKLVIGPLLARTGTGGGSMPSGTGRAGNPFLAGDDRAAELAEHDAFLVLTGDSATKTQLFLERLPITGTVDPWHAPNPFLAAEQSIRFGHPFHPAPKASPGFTAADLDRYAPEVGASFPLHWL